jgi:NADH-quinone oxidoreductase subunit L
MVAALGIGAYVAAAFHLITHAFFKALLFMASGAVIHAMEHGEHAAHHDEHGHAEHPHQPYGMMHAGKGEEVPEWNTDMVPDGIQLDFVADPNNMRHMGGLWKRIPLTAVTLGIGGLSLAGFPLLTAGFWSKDEIFADAWTVGTSDGIYWLHMVVFVFLFVAALLTAFYTGRLWLMTFWGKPRSAAAEHATLMSGHHVHEDKLENTSPLAPFRHWVEIISNDDVVDDSLKGQPAWKRFITVYEDSFPMQLPLVILAFFAATAGWVGIHGDFPILKEITGGTNYFEHLIEHTILETPIPPDFSWLPVIFSFIAALGGLAAAWMVYGMTPMEADEQDPVHRSIGDTAWAALQNRFNLDTVFLRVFYVPFEWFGRRVSYEEVDIKTIDELMLSVGQAAEKIGEAIKRFNFVVIDGVGDGIPRSIGAFSRWFRSVQSGRAQQYMLFVALAVIAMGVMLVLRNQL